MTQAQLPMSAAEAAWLRGPHGAVYAMLVRSLDSPVAALVPGTAGVIDAALSRFRHAGDTAAAQRLEAIALNLHELQLALRLGAPEAVRATRVTLSSLAWDWLLTAPMLTAEHCSELRRAA
jgi:hypothetical protein